VADIAEFHQTTKKNGVASMREMKEVVLKPGVEAGFGPGKKHLMLMDLKKPLKDGDHIPLTLHFKKAGDIQVEIYVQKAPPASNELDHEHHHHD
jgi:copper(I)-binding protein